MAALENKLIKDKRQKIETYLLKPDPNFPISKGFVVKIRALNIFKV